MHAQARMRVYARFSLRPSSVCYKLWDNRRLTGKQSTHIPFHLIIYLVAHATMEPKGPTTLFREEDNQKDNSITQVMQEEVDQMFPLLSTWHNLSANVSRIVNRGNMPNDWVSHISRLAYRMVASGVWLLLQDRLRPLGVVNNRHAVPIDTCESTQGHTHHSQLVAEAMTGLNPILHHNRLSSKDTWLHSCMMLGEHHNWRHVQVDNKPSPWIPCELLTSMIRFNK
jgi:hypothetical protein